MNKSDKLITLPQAKELSELCKEKGIVLMESEYVWRNHPLAKTFTAATAAIVELEGEKPQKRDYKAFCCAELGVILMSKYAIILNKLEEFHCILEPEGNFGGGRTETGKTMAESMCAMLIYLISNGYLTK